MMNTETTWYNGMTLDEMEQVIIMKSLQIHAGNKTKTAEALGISIRTIDNKLEKYEEQKREHTRRAEEKEKRYEQHILRSQGRTEVEPTIETPAQHPVPVRQREEVQEVPFKPSTPNHSHKSGKTNR